jgi:hypothetical protein
MSKRKTKVIIYNNPKKMAKDKQKMIKNGWIVADSVQIPGRYGCLSTGCLGIIFLPLALLGKSKDAWQVTYAKD